MPRVSHGTGDIPSTSKNPQKTQIPSNTLWQFNNIQHSDGKDLFLNGQILVAHFQLPEGTHIHTSCWWSHRSATSSSGSTAWNWRSEAMQVHRPLDPRSNMLKIWSKYQQKRQRPLTTHHTHLPMATHWPLREPFWAMIADSGWRMLEDDFVGNCNRPKAEPSKRPHEWSPLPTTLVKFLLFAHLNIRLQLFNLVAATDFVAYLPSRLVLVTHFRCSKNPNVLFLGNYPHVLAQNSHVFYLSLLAPIYIYIYIYI